MSPDFAATLAGFGSGDAIDLASLTGVSIDTGVGVTAMTTTVAAAFFILRQRIPALSRFRLSAIIPPDSFVLADDGNSGTDLALAGPSIFADDAVPSPDTPTSGSTTVSGLVIHDFDPSVASLTVSAYAGDGTLSLDNTNLTISGTGTLGDPLTATGSLTDINNALAAGVTYTPDSGSPPVNDYVSLSVDDGHGADTLNFVFNQSGNPGALQGTEGKDLIYAPGNQNTTLTGLTGNDTFVFHPDSSVADVIGNGGAQDFHPYDPGNPTAEADRIQLDGFAAYSSFADLAPHITNDTKRQRRDRLGQQPDHYRHRALPPRSCTPAISSSTRDLDDLCPSVAAGRWRGPAGPAPRNPQAAGKPLVILTF